jgi:hypothetical protein
MVKENVKTLEKGNIYFFYRPKINKETVKGINDIERFYVVLSPDGKSPYRLCVIGQKKMPPIYNGGAKYWGFVEKTSKDPEDITQELGPAEYDTKTRGHRKIQPARPVGEGVYQIVEHKDHTHLIYSLELPKEPEKVQKDLNIESEGSFIISVKNPERSGARGVGLPREEKAEYPKELQDKFKNRQFFDVNPPKFLDYEGTAVLLIGSKEDVSRELGIELDTQEESEDTAEIFTDLKLERSKHPIQPLLTGEWK